MTETTLDGLECQLAAARNIVAELEDQIEREKAEALAKRLRGWTKEIAERQRAEAEEAASANLADRLAVIYSAPFARELLAADPSSCLSGFRAAFDVLGLPLPHVIRRGPAGIQGSAVAAKANALLAANA